MGFARKDWHLGEKQKSKKKKRKKSPSKHFFDPVVKHSKLTV